MSTRPTSPHLTIYRKQISSVLSIFHRLTGIALYFGALVVVLWLAICAYRPDNYSNFYEVLASPLGKLAMLGWTIAFYYHLCNGIRHLFWDIGKGFSLPAMHRSGWAVLFFTAFLTSATWALAFSKVTGAE